MCPYVPFPPTPPPERPKREKWTLATSLKELLLLYISKHPVSYSAKHAKIKITQAG